MNHAVRRAASDGRRLRTMQDSVLLIDDRAQIDAATEQLLQATRGHGYPEASEFALRLAVEEAVRNAIVHGHRDLPGEPVELAWDVTDAEVRITVSDKGPGFDPGRLPDPTLDENLRKPSGRGVMLMRSFMSSVKFNESGNRVTMVYAKPDE
jgi:serine/threonine-protein kinase RsbW